MLSTNGLQGKTSVAGEETQPRLGKGPTLSGSHS